jgi:hypothetical protein
VTGVEAGSSRPSTGLGRHMASEKGSAEKGSEVVWVQHLLGPFGQTTLDVFSQRNDGVALPPADRVIG